MRRSIRALGVGIGLTVALHPAGHAQQTPDDEAAVLATLERLFDGMRANDGAMVQSAFAEGAVMIRTGTSGGQPSTNVGPVTGFIAAVGAATEEWDEPFWDPVVQLKDNLATVWTKYAFYRAGTFSHCGVDAFILTRGADGWKISAIADTQERENCELPPGR